MVKELIARQAILVEKQKVIEQELKEIKDQLQDYARKTNPKAKYGNIQVTVAKSSKRSCYTTLEEGIEFITISMKLLNLEEKNKHLETFGSVSGEWKESIHSVRYYRKSIVLTHEGGGYLLLEDCLVCSDEEWEELKKGNLGKFSRLDKFQ